MSLPSEGDLGIALEQEDPNTLFDIIGTIGRGTFGSVYKALNKVTGEVVAVKQVPAIGDTDELKTVIKEIQTLEHCKHPNIVQYRGTYRARSSSELWITMEYCQGGSFDNILKVIKRPLSERLAGYVARQMLEGLAYLHKDHHIHRDIKGGNVLLTETGEVKLTDFGVSAQMMTTISKRNSFVGTLHWMAPETIQEKEYDERADIWSLGITVIELLELKPPNFNMHPARLLFHIPKSAPPTLSQPYDRWSAACHNFLRRCLIKNPEVRPTAAELLTDPFVVNLRGASDDLAELLEEYSGIAEGLSTARKYLGEAEPTPEPTPRAQEEANGTSPPNHTKGASPANAKEDYSDDPTFIVDPGAGGAGGEPSQYLQATESAGMAYQEHLLVDIPLVKLSEVSLTELDVSACAYLGMDTGVGLHSGGTTINAAPGHHSQQGYGGSTHGNNGGCINANNYFETLDPVALLTSRYSVGPPPAPVVPSVGPKHHAGSKSTTGAAAAKVGSTTHTGTAQQYSSTGAGGQDESSFSAGADEEAAEDTGATYVPTVPKHLTHSTKMMLHCFDYQSQGKFTAGVTEAQVHESVALTEKYGSLLKSTLQI